MGTNDAKTELEKEINRRPNDNFLALVTSKFMVSNYNWVQDLPKRVTVMVDDDFFLTLDPSIPLNFAEIIMVSNETVFKGVLDKVIFRAIIEGGVK